ncbi:peptidoglycan-binding protein [Tropicimonas aquimaris]|uniref:Peptidoglycan-binding protein n=1 Tax=Tropicimonas aquimaris TaxID=914152 RepID=A0ABW3IW22_9RHOB
MKRLMMLPLLAGLACTVALPAAADRALVIGAPEAQRRGLLRTPEITDTAEALRRAGFEVITADAGSITEMRAALSTFMRDLAQEERVLVHLSGSFVSGGGRSWLLVEGLERMPDLATADDVGLSIETVLQIAARVQGRSVVALGNATAVAGPGDGLSAGPQVEPPQGVTLVQGGAEQVADFVANQLLQEGRTLPEAIAASSGVAGAGFLSEAVEFLPLGAERPPAPPNAAEVERALWQAAQAQDSMAAYEGYLQRYPQGFFATEARAAVEKIRNEPDRDARLIEEALELDRASRRVIQENLAVLGHAPGGADGVFGPASRAAISRFQTANGFPSTSYLNERQIGRLAFQAERRQAEIEAEERRAQLEREKADRETWAALNEGADEAGLRTYLDRYPDGLFAPIARERLARIEAEAQEVAARQDRQDWTAARKAGTVTAYRAYLEAHPDGARAETARERIEALEGAGSEADKAAQAAEAALQMTPTSRMVIERRLEQLGHDPGLVDGTFDDDTRAAIRRFQRSRGLQPTGYVGEETVVAMLSDFGSLFGTGR